MSEIQVKAHNGKVKCDNCTWEKAVEFEDMPNYYDEQCPECNNCILVNDKDLEAWQALKATLELFPCDEKVNGSIVVNAKFSTGHIRKNTREGE